MFTYNFLQSKLQIRKNGVLNDRRPYLYTALFMCLILHSFKNTLDSVKQEHFRLNTILRFTGLFRFFFSNYNTE